MNCLGPMLYVLVAIALLPYAGLGLVLLDLMRWLAARCLGWRWLGQPRVSRLMWAGGICLVVSAVVFSVTGFRLWIPFVGW